MTDIDPNIDPTPPRRPPRTGPVRYKGEELDAERGPGLGCFRFQVVVLVVFIVLTPLSVVWNWPPAISTILLFAVILLLLLTGQTIIFLLRLVAMDRRGRHRPLASETRTVGELEDEAAARANAPAPDGAERSGGAEPSGGAEAAKEASESARSPASREGPDQRPHGGR